MTTKLHTLVRGLVAAGILAAATTLGAQTFPTKPVRIVVPFPPGSAGDIAARVVGKEMQASLGQAVVVENRPGAQGTIGAEAAARSAPDGYTLLLAAISFAAAPSEFKRIGYDPVKDFDPVGMIGTLPLVLVVKPDFPARDIAGIVGHAKSRSTPLTGGYGSSSSRVAIAQLRTLGKVDVSEVAYKGIPPAITDVIAGATDLTFADLGNAMTHIRAGTLRALGVTSAKRSPLVPDIPSISETLPSYDLYAWISLVAPAGTPADITQRLNAEINRALQKPEVQTTLAGAGMSASPMARDELGTFIRREVGRWAELNRSAGIEPQ